MNEPLTLRYDIDGENFTSAGEASVKVKKALRQLGFSQEIIRRVSIAMYEGEINMGTKRKASSVLHDRSSRSGAESRSAIQKPTPVSARLSCPKVLSAC